MSNTKTEPLKIGFDMDGVLLYNPARILRPVTVALKSMLPKTEKKDDISFYFPKSPLEEFIWKLVHKSSLFIAPGLNEIFKLVDDKKAVAHIVSGRFGCLEHDFLRWTSRLNGDNHFQSVNFNKDNLQPHEFKAKMINELGIEVYVEDNWDITRHLTKNTSAKILWITNSLDSKIDYEYKFGSLSEVAKYLIKESKV